MLGHLSKEMFSEWQPPAQLFARADAAVDEVGDAFFSGRRTRHLREAWVIGKAGQLIGAQLAKLALYDPPDAYLVLESMTVPVEITELMAAGRRRGDEFKPGGKVHPPMRVLSKAEMDVPEDNNVGWLEERIKAKLAHDRLYPPNSLLLVYHNTGLWNFRPEKTRKELEAAAQMRATNIVGSIILYGDELYGRDTLSRLG